MKEALDDFIREHRRAFDDKEPSEKVWNNVSASLPVKAKTSLWNSVILWRAAAVIFMALSIYLLVPKNQSGVKHDTAALSEFRDVEAFYAQQISEKEDIIGAFKRNDGLNGFTKDFEQLEAMYEVLKEEMKTRPSEKVKDALVLNLMVRIDLLNQQLHKLEEVRKEKKASEKNV